jgi:uncharacterized membrane protein
MEHMNMHDDMQMNHDDKKYIEDPGAMMLEHPSMYKWAQPVIMVLSVWLMSSWSVFQYENLAMLISDVLSGLLAFAIAAVALRFPKISWISYANAFVGVWLLLAPLFFWAPDAVLYVNDTLIGIFLITFSFVIPMSMRMQGPDIPPGWSYNPSSWPQRAPIIVLGLLGYFLARPMAAYQLGYIHNVWDPFFGQGTLSVLNSEVSKAWPISDAGLGAATYLIEVLSTFMGDEKRWRTMPWMVAMFGFVVIPLGVTSIILVMMQPMVVGAWCTLCLITAFAMLLMVPLALDEVVAMIQFLNQSRREGKSIWHVFWHGGTLPDASNEPREDRKSSWNVPAMAWGVGNHWGLTASMLIGVWILVVPALSGMTGFAADNNFLVGALIITIAAISYAEVARSARYLNILFGAWLLLSPWWAEGVTSFGQWGTAMAGLLIIPLSLPLGQIRDEYGTFDPWVKWKPYSIKDTARILHEPYERRRVLKERST